VSSGTTVASALRSRVSSDFRINDVGDGPGTRRVRSVVNSHLPRVGDADEVLRMDRWLFAIRDCDETLTN